MNTINPEHIAAVLDMINNGPYFRLLAMEVTRLEPGLALVEVDLDTRHQNPFGTVHGGVYSSIMDTAAYWSAYCDMDEETGFTTLDINVTNLAPMKSGPVVVEGVLVKKGKTVCLATATVKNRDGKVLAHGTSKMIITPRQTMNHILESMGMGPLPPKFLLEPTNTRGT